MSWTAAMAAATRADLGRGSWWLLALAAFLVRGGLLLVLPAIVVLPTPAEIASLASPSLLGGSLDSPTPALVVLVSISLVSLVAILVTTTLVGTWLEVALVDASAADDELAALHPGAKEPSRPAEEAGAASGLRRVPFWSAVTVRLAAHVPTAIAVVVGVFVVTGATIAELESPGSGSPLVLRILLRAPLATAAVITMWFLGEAWGSLAIRRLATVASVAISLRRGLLDLVRPSGLATLVLSSAVVILPLVAVWLSGERAFDRLRPLLLEPSDDRVVLLALGLFVGTWAVGLWLLAIGLAWRSVAWTAEVMRQP